MTNLKRIRIQAGLTLTGLALIMKASPQAIHRNERYGIKTTRIAKKYAAALGCDPMEIIEL